MTSSDAPPRAEPAATWTILDVLKWTSTRFAERGLPSPRLDAELLAGHAFGLERVALYTQFDRPLSAAELARFRELVKRRQAGEPVAYLTGRKHFWNLELEVDRRVLVPRPDTETAVEAALDFCRSGAAAGESPPALRLADIGTGSGAIALVLKKELPHAEVLAVDSSADALEVARSNAERLGLAVTFLQGDLLEPLAGLAPLDLIVANLPYVPSGDIAQLAPEVRSEPLAALDGGEDGLMLVRRLVGGAGSVLGPGGGLVLEVGMDQGEAVAELVRQGGLAEVDLRRDLAGVWRVVVGRRSTEPA
jgi:release factor glutamine methyltransferase